MAEQNKISHAELEAKSIWSPKECARSLGITTAALRRLELRGDPNFPTPTRLTAKLVRYDANAVRRWALGGDGGGV